jgi:uncharacterized membrane protein (UPF0136 family)
MSLAAAILVTMLVSSRLDLGLEPTILLGAVVGAVVGTVPDRSTAMRLAGFAAGFVLAWVGYLLRASQLPDTNAGRAVVVLAVVVLCLGVTLASMGRVPLWATLLGAAAFSGAYEYTYAEAPPEVVSTSLTVATALIFNIAIGFLSVAWVGPEPAPRTTQRARHLDGRDDETVPLDTMMDSKR